MLPCIYIKPLCVRVLGCFKRPESNLIGTYQLLSGGFMCLKLSRQLANATLFWTYEDNTSASSGAYDFICVCWSPKTFDHY